jgi:hypothetical protein
MLTRYHEVTEQELPGSDPARHDEGHTGLVIRREVLSVTLVLGFFTLTDSFLVTDRLVSLQRRGGAFVGSTTTAALPLKWRLDCKDVRS